MQGRLTGKQYPDTSTVTYAYEATTSRLKSVTDALSQVKSYSYAKDDRLLGIVASRTVQGAGAETFQYDAIGRLTGHGSDLGAFGDRSLRNNCAAFRRIVRCRPAPLTWCG